MVVVDGEMTIEEEEVWVYLLHHLFEDGLVLCKSLSLSMLLLFSLNRARISRNALFDWNAIGKFVAVLYGVVLQFNNIISNLFIFSQQDITISAEE